MLAPFVTKKKEKTQPGFDLLAELGSASIHSIIQIRI